jgi:hypothetical protein
MSVTRIVGLCMLLAASVVRAETLLVDTVEADEQTASQRPTPGQTMDRVEATYGEPTERREPVGDPPIARWEYPGFIVYFERDKVIHTVVRH